VWDWDFFISFKNIQVPKSFVVSALYFMLHSFTTPRPFFAFFAQNKGSTSRFLL
jgi:hypothetical protein